MKNKEIEELLNELQRRKQRYDYCKNNDISFSDEDYKSYLLLSYIEQLEKRNKELYEGFIAMSDERCEYATKCEQLEKNRDKAIEILGQYKHYSTPTEEQNRENEDTVDNAYNILKGDSDE